MVSRVSAIRSTRLQPRTMRATCSAVPARPTLSSRSSVSGVATRVSARTFEYDSSPRASAPASNGSMPSARATRTRSRAAPGSSPTRHVSHAAQERKPLPQPPRRSKSRMRSSSRAVAASRWADSSAMSSPRRSSSGVFIGASPLLFAAPTLHLGFRRPPATPGRAIAARAGIFGGHDPTSRMTSTRAAAAEFRGDCAR